MKKVLFITYDSPNIDRRIYLFADALQKNNYDVSILSPMAVPEEGYGHINVIKLFNNNFSGHYSFALRIKKILQGRIPPKFLKFAANVYRSLFAKDGYIPFFDEMVSKALEINPDIFVAIDLPTLPIVDKCLESKQAVFIYDAHEFYLGQDVFTIKQRKKLQEIEEKIYPKIDFLITVNKDIQNLFFQKYSIKPGEVIYNATKNISGKDNYIHDLIGLDRDEKILLYQGGFIENRNIEKLIEISKFLRNCKLVLLGWGSSESKLRELATRQGVINNTCFFVPKISQFDLISYTKSATFGVIPYTPYDINTKFCTPNKLFEFICAQVPILFNSSLHTVKNIVESSGIGKSINFENVESAAMIIDDLVADTNLLNSYEQNLVKALDIYNWNIEEEKIIKIFNTASELLKD